MTRQLHIDPPSAAVATPEFSAGRPLAGSWSILHDELIRGILHGINNRIAALSAFVELASLDGAALEVGDVRPELVRLLETSQLLARLVAPSASAEALEVRPQLDLALTIHGYHPRAHAVVYEVVQPVAILPVRVPRWALARLLLLLIDGARGTTPSRLELTGDAANIRLATSANAGVDEDARALAHICGAQLEVQGDRLVLTIPVLRKESSAI